MSDDREIVGAHTAVDRILQRGYLNVEAPDQSLILLKPLAEDAGGVWHGGGTKMRDTDDLLYIPLHAWVEHVASCRELSNINME